MQGMQDSRGMLTRIPGIVIKDSGESLRRFGGMLLKILENVTADYGECY